MIWYYNRTDTSPTWSNTASEIPHHQPANECDRPPCTLHLAFLDTTCYLTTLPTIGWDRKLRALRARCLSTTNVYHERKEGGIGYDRHSESRTARLLWAGNYKIPYPSLGPSSPSSLPRSNRTAISKVHQQTISYRRQVATTYPDEFANTAPVLCFGECR